MQRPTLSVLLIPLFVVAVSMPALVAAAAWLAPAFPGKWLYAVVIGALAAERVWSMFFRMRQRCTVDRDTDWTTLTVGYSYAGVFCLTVADVFCLRRSAPLPAVVAAGIGVYLLGVCLRYWAFSHLRHQWTVHVDESVANRRLVTDGPYGWVRHPLYLGACVEALALPAAFSAWPGLLVAAVCFVPAEIQRAYFEERFLRLTFGAAYDDYAARTWAFFPLPCGRKASGA